MLNSQISSGPDALVVDALAQQWNHLKFPYAFPPFAEVPTENTGGESLSYAHHSSSLASSALVPYGIPDTSQAPNRRWPFWISGWRWWWWLRRRSVWYGIRRRKSVSICRIKGYQCPEFHLKLQTFRKLSLNLQCFLEKINSKIIWLCMEPLDWLVSSKVDWSTECWLVSILLFQDSCKEYSTHDPRVLSTPQLGMWTE